MGMGRGSTGQLIVMQLGLKAFVVASCFFAAAFVFESRVMSGGSIYRNTVWFIKGLREYTRFEREGEKEGEKEVD